MEFRLQPGSVNPLNGVVANTHQWLCAAIIPCWNEARTIAPLVQATMPLVTSVWVIDDGSSDTTQPEAEKAGAAVIRHQTNLGKGAALRDGFAAARAAGYEWAVTLDGDGQHDPAEIPGFFQAAARGADLIIGNRMSDPQGMSPLRRYVNRWMSRKMEQRLGITCPDSQCGFRLVRLDAWAGVRLRQNHYEVESEMLAAFARAGLRIDFVPIRCLPAQRPSRIHPLADSVRWLSWWLHSNH
jgi:glycosyltransferase involved in cell wall biosynthesis